MIEHLVMAFFVVQPVQPAGGSSAPDTRGPAKVQVSQVRDPVEITAKQVAFSRRDAVFKEDVVARHRTMDLRCDEMRAFHNDARTVTRGECVGNVRAVDGDRTARSERADFDVPTGVLVMTGNPEASDPTTQLRGSEIRLTLGNSNFEVKDAFLTLDAAPLTARGSQLHNPVEITSKRVAGTRSQAVFTGDVVVKHRTMDLRCDKMTVYYNGPREVTRGECAGHVRAVDGNRTAKGERADFDVPTGVLVLTGNPEARDPTTHVRGSEVRMTVGKSNFEVKDAVITVETAPLREQQQRRKSGNGNPDNTPGRTNTGSTKQP